MPFFDLLCGAVLCLVIGFILGHVQGGEKVKKGLRTTVEKLVTDLDESLSAKRKLEEDILGYQSTLKAVEKQVSHLKTGKLKMKTADKDGSAKFWKRICLGSGID
ncbi:hypothetical protein CYMTET_25904 [Cymbomonas tetramitiformis]|uniref:Uncharacterized protein n=1 Tax=Cymbomonas tetramitiformis TaxID=36881 RepID=A0AAE0FSU5_9CHLO|nr:hypothetical protein CYMTET_25904 [Cymbomonas tetramitiformis]